MAKQDRASGRDSGSPTPQDEVVRLPVSDHDLSNQLEAMPAPKRPVRLQPSPAVDLMEEEGEEPIEFKPADLRMAWEEEEAESRQTPVGWIVMIGVILLILGGWALGKLSKGEAHLDEEVERLEAGRQEEARRQRQAEELLTRVERAVASYLKAGTIPEKGRYVRQAERVLPLMEAYYQRHRLEPVRFERVKNIQPLGIGKRPFVFILIKVEDEKSLMLIAEETPEGELKFDWEAEVAYQPMDLKDYIEQKPATAMDFRVYARLDNFYSYEFSDPERYQALLLTERDSEEFLFGYIEKGTEDERMLTEILLREIRRGQPIMLRLRFLPGTSARRSVLVEKLIAPRWVYVESPKDED